jgi:cytochrome b561
MRAGAYPIDQQLLYDLLFPPIGTCLWWLMARGWARAVQGGKPSETTKKRQKWEFWVVLVCLYLLMFGITIYGLLTT